MKTTLHGVNLIQLTRFPRLFPINTYLVREQDGFTLLDTGVSGSARTIIKAADEHGLPIVRIALTHAHSDHAGSLDQLRTLVPDAEVLVGAREARFLAGDRSLDPDEPSSKLRGGFVTSETRPTDLLSNGDRIGSLEVIDALGHTPGQIAFFDHRDRTLIAGDAFQTRGGVAVAGSIRPLFPFPALFTWDKPTALASARALRELEPERLAVGHGVVLENPLAAIDRAIMKAERSLGGEATSVV